MRCPYCKAEIVSLQARSLEEFPLAEQVVSQLSGKKLSADTEVCPSCGQTMHIRRHPGTKEVFLLDKEDACSLDALRLANLSLRVAADPFATYLSRPAEDTRSAAVRIWGVLDRARRTALKKGDWDTVSKLLFQKARYRCSIGKDFFSVQQDAFRYQLKALQAKGATQVRVVSGQDALTCSECAKQAGAVFSIDEALEHMPLPVRCDTHGRQRTIDDDPGWCRCLYVRQS